MTSRSDKKLNRRIDPDHLWVECWCQTEIVQVPVSEVRELRTRSCGLPRCKEAK